LSSAAADGEILLARTLPGNWNDGAERMAMDLNRTIHSSTSSMA